MRYYILSPRGRTGGRRLMLMLEYYCNFNQIRNTLHIVPIPFEINSGSVKFWTSTFDFSSEKEIKTYAEVQEILRTCEDKTTVHSHSMMPIPDLKNWTVIHSSRKSKAEQIMSVFITQHVNSFIPLSKDIKFEPFEMKKEIVLDYLATILKDDEKVKEMFPDCIEIFLEDTYSQIQEKLKITFDADTLSAIDKTTVSNHRYPDLITNYLDVFKWCGEEPPV